MKADFKLNILFTAVFLILNGCGKKGEVVTFESVCQTENQSEVQINGFIRQTKNTPDLTPNSALLVEHKNGTGGFIKLMFANDFREKEIGEVKITGKILKENNLCVLKVEKIEAR